MSAKNQNNNSKPKIKRKIRINFYGLVEVLGAKNTLIVLAILFVSQPDNYALLILAAAYVIYMIFLIRDMSSKSHDGNSSYRGWLALLTPIILFFSDNWIAWIIAILWLSVDITIIIILRKKIFFPYTKK